MIYTIVMANDDEFYRDVNLDMTLTSWDEDVFSHRLTLEKETMTISEQWVRSPSAEVTFEEVALKDVPRWGRCMADKMHPQIVAQYFQPLIDEWQIRQAETEQTR